jgi:choline dehydrogenase
VIELGFGADPRDLQDFAQGTRFAWRVATSLAMTREVERIAGLDEETIGSEARLRDYVMANVASFNHACGTAPMGPEADPLAVTDPRGHVHGVEGLWIADASLMPRGVSSPPNLTTIMLGERVARWLRDAPNRGQRRDPARPVLSAIEPKLTT